MNSASPRLRCTCVTSDPRPATSARPGSAHSWTLGGKRRGRSGDRGDVVAEPRWCHVRVADRKATADIDDVDGNPAPGDHPAGACDRPRIVISAEALRADMERDAETSGV